MLSSYLRHYWLTGVATAAVCATAAYVAFGIPLEQPYERRSKKNKGSVGISGLTNEGSTCFINTTLQALASCPSFFQWISTVLHRSEGYLSLKTLQSLQTVLLVINNSHPTLKADPFSTKQLVESIEKRGWNLRSEEQDAHEFFNILFTAIEEENNNRADLRCSISISEIPNEYVNSFSPFRGYLASQLSCLSCGHKVPVHYDAFECLSIPLPKVDPHSVFTVVTIDTLVKRFLAAETVGEVHCDNCTTKTSAFVKQLSIGKLPRCLCLHIQRSHWTDMGQLVKRQDLVKFQEELNVSHYTYNNRLVKNWKPIIYRLQSVVVHLGAVDSGHFVTYRRNWDTNSRKWFYTSDTYVRSAKLEEVLNSCPYMLFYERAV